MGRQVRRKPRVSESSKIPNVVLRAHFRKMKWCTLPVVRIPYRFPWETVPTKQTGNHAMGTYIHQKMQSATTLGLRDDPKFGWVYRAGPGNLDGTIGGFSA